MRTITIIIGVVLVLGGAYALWVSGKYGENAEASARYVLQDRQRAEMHRKFAEEYKQSASQCFWGGGASLIAGIGALFLAIRVSGKRSGEQGSTGNEKGDEKRTRTDADRF